MSHKIPHPKKNNDSEKVFLTKAVGLALAIVIGITLFSWMLTHKPDMTDEAIKACEKYISSKAKFPGSVRFPDKMQMDRETNKDGHEEYFSAGNVDFPNAFGTLKRGEYYCSATFDGKKLIDVDGLVLGIQ